MMNDTYLYPYSSAEARDRNELPLWRESHKANIACRNAIEDAIRQNFDGMHLDKNCITPVLEEYGTRYALTLYVCVAILAVLFVPETELALFYVLVMGYYPVLRVKLNGVKSTLLRWVLKFAVFNAGTVLVYLLLFALLGPAVLDELLADGIGMLAALLAAGNLSFWLCDRALAALTRYYHVILKPKLKKKF